MVLCLKITSTGSYELLQSNRIEWNFAFINPICVSESELRKKLDILKIEADIRHFIFDRG